MVLLARSQKLDGVIVDKTMKNVLVSGELFRSMDGIILITLSCLVDRLMMRLAKWKSI